MPGGDWHSLSRGAGGAVAIGEELGVYRDYPVSKGCTSPYAPIWIGEMVRRAEVGSTDCRRAVGAAAGEFSLWRAAPDIR